MIREDIGWAPTAVLYIRDALGLPTDRPFHVPRVAYPVPASCEGDGPVAAELAEDWAAWFADVLAHDESVATDPREFLGVSGYSPAFQHAVEDRLDAAYACADNLKGRYIDDFLRESHEQRLLLNRLVKSVEKSVRHRAAPFDLRLVTITVEGSWLRRVGRQFVLMSTELRHDPERLSESLGPILTELASTR